MGITSQILHFFLGSLTKFFQQILWKLHTKFGAFVQQITFFRLRDRTGRRISRKPKKKTQLCSLWNVHCAKIVLNGFLIFKPEVSPTTVQKKIQFKISLTFHKFYCRLPMKMILSKRISKNIVQVFISLVPNYCCYVVSL